MRAAFTSGCREGPLSKKRGVGAVPTIPWGLLYAVAPPFPKGGGAHMRVPPPARRDRGETCTPSAARATRPPLLWLCQRGPGGRLAEFSSLSGPLPVTRAVTTSPPPPPPVFGRAFGQSLEGWLAFRFFLLTRTSSRHGRVGARALGPAALVTRAWARGMKPACFPLCPQGNCPPCSAQGLLSLWSSA